GFNANVRGQTLPYDVEHEPKKGAAGWFLPGTMRDVGGHLMVNVELTPKGVRLIQDDEYRFSSISFMPAWTDPESGRTYIDVVFGAAMTTEPFIKGLAPIQSGMATICLSEFRAVNGSHRQREDHTMSSIDIALERAVAPLRTQLSELEDDRQRNLREVRRQRTELAEAKADSARRAAKEKYEPKLKRLVLDKTTRGKLLDTLVDMAADDPAKADAHMDTLGKMANDVSSRCSGHDGALLTELDEDADPPELALFKEAKTIQQQSHDAGKPVTFHEAYVGLLSKL
ncbi:MAG TPA: phage protease, partial [Candidatus Xenobia bacterium]